MLHNEARNLLVEAYEKTHDAKGIASAYGVSVPTAYRLAEQKAKTGSVDLRVSERGRKRVLGPEAYEQIAKTVDEQPDITLAEIVEKLELAVGELLHNAGAEVLYLPPYSPDLNPKEVLTTISRERSAALSGTH